MSAPAPVATPAFATAAATRACADRASATHGFSAGAYRLLGRTGLTASALGFGGYRVDDETPEHREALEAALAGGVSLVDTSSNYTDGGSERLIGRVLGAGLAARPGLREQVIVVSKVGYVQGQNLALAHQAQERGQPFLEMVEYHPDCWHCIHPRFLADQLGRTLERLALPALDVYLLHNPEYFFSDWAQRTPQGDLEAARAEFYRRCTQAFAELERQAQQGRIAWYGVSSNAFGEPAASPEFVSLERLLDCAAAAVASVQGAGAASRFAVVQCPLNLFEGGPACEANQSGGRTFLDVARAENLGVLVNRPLNAIRQRHLIRLADRMAPRGDPAAQVETALADLAGIEAEYARQFRPSILDQLPERAGPREPFDWSTAFRSVLPHVESREGWMQMLHSQALPNIQGAMRATAQALTEPPARKDFERWVQSYAMALENLSRAMLEHAAAAEHRHAADLRQRLSGRVPEAWRGQSLSQMALRTVLTVPGVSCVLNGMRRPEYVRDSLGALTEPATNGAQGLDVIRAWA